MSFQFLVNINRSYTNYTYKYCSCLFRNFRFFFQKKLLNFSLFKLNGILDGMYFKFQQYNLILTSFRYLSRKLNGFNNIFQQFEPHTQTTHHNCDASIFAQKVFHRFVRYTQMALAFSSHFTFSMKPFLAIWPFASQFHMFICSILQLRNAY